ncbi:methylthioribulose 1-phosphate dehydratase [Aureibacillus halotolerans]|uniref:Methylthioribulose-1-phosphate dehydratase n=1 Tax=Aureibacillus halotolerans TaxID=1508390 RepID=A0A4R6U9P6_9BACI|nr:methylthioribulose 1-phosphate dehydratase [Aureibacillus halotolerans]TDQ39794.1 methylthioribulose-1-phosphate dehydratase [Aureibacillus halotolerans]
MTQWEELADVKATLAKKGWFPATSGNLSIKLEDSPLHALVSVSGKDKTKSSPEDFVVVDRDGKTIESSLKPSAETIIHTRLYEVTDAGCILHVHTVENNLISALYKDEGQATFTDHELLKAFGLWEENAALTMPIVDNLHDLPALAEEMVRVVTPETKAILILNHGITVWGKNAFDAQKNLEAAEFLFAYRLAQFKYNLLKREDV